MIQVFSKTPQQIEEEQRGKIDRMKPICFRYVNYNGANIDIEDLRSKEIIDIVRLNLEEIVATSGKVKKMPREITSFICEIGKLDGFNHITIDVVIGLLSLGEIYGEKLMVDFLGMNHFLHEAMIITTFNKELNGDFSELTLSEIMTTLDQMRENIMARSSVRQRIPA